MNFDFLDKELFGGISGFDLLISLLFILTVFLFGKLLTIYLKRFFKSKLSEDSIKIISKVIYLIALLLSLIVVLPILGINPSGLLVAGGLVAIVIGFASQSIVGNLISGIFLLLERPFKVGDMVAIADSEGFIEDISIVSTTIKTFDGNRVRIPNEMVFTTKFTNYVSHIARRFEYVVGIPYRIESDRAIRIIRRTVDDHPFVLVNPEPNIFVKNLGDNAQEISVRLWVPSEMWWPVKTELLGKIKRDLEAEGIHVPFPQREVWFNSPIHNLNETISHPSEEKSL